MGFHGGPMGGGPGGIHGPFSTQSEEQKVERKISDSVLIKRLLTYLTPYKVRLAALMVLMVGAALVGLASPIMTRIVLDSYIIPGMTTGQTSGLDFWLLALIGLVLVQFGLTYGRENLIAWLGNNVVFKLRDSTVSQLQDMSLRYFSESETGRIMSRATNDAEELSYFFSLAFVSVVGDTVALVGSLLLMFTMDLGLTLISLVVLPVMFLIPFIMRRYIGKAWMRTRVKMAGMTSVAQESIAGMRVIQAFAQEGRDMESFNIASQETVKARLWATVLSGVMMATVGLGQVVGTIALLWYGAMHIVDGTLTFGTLVAFQSLVMNFQMPLMQIMQFYNEFESAMAATERIFELLDTEQEIKEAPEGERVTLEEARGEIVYSHVVFGYEKDNLALNDVSLNILPDEKVALVGPTGAGKTTMINLLSRFYDPQSGYITLDGYDLREISLQSLRKNMGIVLQDAFLFQGTVKENIRYGRPDATDEEIVAAAKAVNGHEFIMRLPEGYETEIREGASNISIGQRQLITFARALIVNPRILILDEATSSVDPYTELIIQQGLERLLENRTSIIIAHRLSTVRNSDEIVVIDHGKIVEMGTHDELLAKGGVYSNLYLKQFREEPEEEVKQRMPPPMMAGAIGSMPGMGMPGMTVEGMRGPSVGAGSEETRMKMMEFTRLLREKQSEGFNISEFKELGMKLIGTLRSGDASARRTLDEAIERLRALKH